MIFMINFFDFNLREKKSLLKDSSEEELKLSVNNFAESKFNKNLKLNLNNLGRIIKYIKI